MGSCSITIIPDSGIFGGRETTITDLKKPDKSLCFHISAPAIATDYIASFDHIEGHFGQHPLLTENDTIDCTIELIDEFMSLDEELYWQFINGTIYNEMRHLRDELAWVLNGNLYLLKKLEIIETTFKIVDFNDYDEAAFPVKFNPYECPRQIKGEVAYLVITRPQYSEIIATVRLFCNGKDYGNFPHEIRALEKHIEDLKTRQPKIIPYPYA